MLQGAHKENGHLPPGQRRTQIQGSGRSTLNNAHTHQNRQRLRAVSIHIDGQGVALHWVGSDVQCAEGGVEQLHGGAPGEGVVRAPGEHHAFFSGPLGGLLIEAAYMVVTRSARVAVSRGA